MARVFKLLLSFTIFVHMCLTQSVDIDAYYSSSDLPTKLMFQFNVYTPGSSLTLPLKDVNVVVAYMKLFCVMTQQMMFVFSVVAV